MLCAHFVSGSYQAIGYIRFEDYLKSVKVLYKQLQSHCERKNITYKHKTLGFYMCKFSSIPEFLSNKVNKKINME